MKDAIIHSVIDIESGRDLQKGGCHHDSFDLGGKTQFGISSVYNPSLASKIDKCQLTYDDAYSYYSFRYDNFRYVNLNKLSHSGLAFTLFDMSIHGFDRNFIKYIQTFINIVSKASLRVDGILGPKTGTYIENLDFNHCAVLLRVGKKIIPHLAKAQAQRVMRKQRAQGRPEYNYERGFANRWNLRFSYA